MNNMDGLPSEMPSREDATARAMRMRYFSPVSIAYFGFASAVGFGCMIALPWWRPPWWMLLLMFAFIFVHAGIIAIGRYESNKIDAAFIVQVERMSEENKRGMN
jgi:hypothetical protein